MERAPWLDALRLVAASAVFAFHALYLTPVLEIPAGVQRIACHGYLGVETFFMISGYVIPLSATGRTRPAFARARATRLWPAFLISAVACQGVRAIQGDPLPAGYFLANLTMLPRLFDAPYLDSVYWTLMFELTFYGYIALILGAGFLARLRLFAALWLALAIAAWFAPLPYGTLLLVPYSPCFVTGIAIYLIRTQKRPIDWMLGAVALGAAMATAAWNADSIGQGLPIEPRPAIAATIVGLSALAIAWAATAKSRMAPLLVAAGGISYPLYLLQNGVGSAVEQWFGLLVGAGLVFVLAYAVWRIERIIRSRLARLGSRPA